MPPIEFNKHWFWTNFALSKIKEIDRGMGKNENIKDLYKRKGFNLSKYKGIDKRKTLRNCVEPTTAKHIFDCAFKNMSLF